MLLHELSNHLPIACSINFITDRTNYNQKFYRDTAKFNKENFLDDVSDLLEKLSNDLTISLLTGLSR